MPETKAMRAIVILGEGAEEMEVVVPIDVLRRAGVKVVVAGLAGSAPVTCSRGVNIVPDITLDAALAPGTPFDLVLIPGGLEGAKACTASPVVQELLATQNRAGRLLGGICAGPMALKAAGVIAGRAFTCHPAVREELAPAGKHLEQRVVRDGNLLTSQGPGTVFDFALALVEALLGRERAEAVAGPMLVQKW